MPFLIEVIKDLHPKANLANYQTLGMLIIKEFNMKVPEIEFERYFSPSLEGIESEYKYKLNMVE